MKNRTRKIIRSAAQIESLETRQLMSLTFDVQAVSVTGSGVTRVNSKSVTVTGASVGGSITFEVRALVSGANTTFNDEKFWSAAYRLVSASAGTGNAVTGDMVNDDGGVSLGELAPFDTLFNNAGTLQDIDGDGDKDIGGTNLLDDLGMISSRSTTATNGSASSTPASFLLYRFRMGIGSASTLSTTETDVKLQVANFGPLWYEDGVFKSGTTGTVGVNSPVVIRPVGTATGASVSGTVFSDADGNGSKGTTETGLSGWTVFYDANKNSLLDAGELSTTTSSTGAYTLAGLPAGTDRIFLKLPTGNRYTNPWNGLTDVVLSTNQAVTGKNFGATSNALQSATVFGDVNSDKTKNSTEVGLSGWVVYLDTNNNGALDSGEKNQTTDTSGNVFFRDIPAGTYNMRVVQKAGFVVTTPTGGVFNFTLAAGQTGGTKLFGEVAGTVTTNSSVAGNIYNDVNQNSAKDSGEANLATWTVFDDSNSNGTLDSGEKSATTDASGNYTLSALTNGAHRIMLVLKSGYKYVNPSVGYYNVTLASAQALTGQNFGAAVVSTGTTGTVSGTVFSDADGNGSKASTEVGLSGWTVFFDANKNNVLDTGEINTTTNASGAFTLSGLPVGTDRIYLKLNSGYRYTNPWNGLVDQALTAGQIVTGKLFGVTSNALINGNVFRDANGNGSKDSTETGLSAWTVFIDTNNNGVLNSGEKSQITDTSGNYFFRDVAAGTYILRVVAKAGFTLVNPSAGFHSVTVASGQTITKNFAEKPA